MPSYIQNLGRSMCNAIRCTWESLRNLTFHNATTNIYLLPSPLFILHFSCVFLISLWTSSAKGTTSSCLAARGAPTSGEIHKGVCGTALVDECVSAIHGCILRAPFASYLRSNQLVYTTHTLVSKTHQGCRKTGRLGCKHRQDASRWRVLPTSKGRENA